LAWQFEAVTSRHSRRGGKDCDGVCVPKFSNVWEGCATMSSASTQALTAPVSIVIADTHPLLPGTLKDLFADQSGIHTVSHSRSLDQLPQLLADSTNQVDVVVMHVVRADIGVQRAIRRITEAAHSDSGPYVLVVSGSESDDEVFACIRSGARGYISVSARFPVLLLTVQLVAQGGAGFNASVADRLVGFPPEPPAEPDRTDLEPADPDQADPTRPGPLGGLTVREREVLELLSCGHNNRVIARKLFLSERTVRNHLSRVFLKLGVQDRLQAAILMRNSPSSQSG
jgi:DNA-binding NarL/FixJ family response regulator